jgi:hypothetical protein
VIRTSLIFTSAPFLCDASGQCRKCYIIDQFGHHILLHELPNLPGLQRTNLIIDRHPVSRFNPPTHAASHGTPLQILVNCPNMHQHHQASANALITCPHEGNGATGTRTGPYPSASFGTARRAQSACKREVTPMHKTAPITSLTVFRARKTLLPITEPNLQVACLLSNCGTVMAVCQELQTGLLPKKPSTANAESAHAASAASNSC